MVACKLVSWKLRVPFCNLYFFSTDCYTLYFVTIAGFFFDALSTSLLFYFLPSPKTYVVKIPPETNKPTYTGTVSV